MWILFYSVEVIVTSSDRERLLRPFKEEEEEEEEEKKKQKEKSVRKKKDKKKEGIYQRKGEQKTRN